MKRSITRIAIPALVLLMAAGRSSGHPENRSGSIPPLPAPLIFEENRGQIKDPGGMTRRDIDFSLSASDLTVFVGSGHIHYQWTKAAPLQHSFPLPGAGGEQSLRMEAYRMDVVLLGANTNARVTTGKPASSFNRYLVQGQKDLVRTNHYRTITYHEVYPDIDWVLYVQDREDEETGIVTPHLEYDFIVHPGGSVSDIRIAYKGATSLKKNPDGSISAVTPAGFVTERAPYSYAEDGTTIPSSFELDAQNHMIAFRTGKYTGMLTIDPVIAWGTYYGVQSANTTSDVEYPYAVTTDRLGNVYMAGYTTSTAEIATSGAHQTIYSGYQSAFLVKFSCDGRRIWGTYYGSVPERRTIATSLATDTEGNLYMAGYTSCPDSISTGAAHQQTLGGGSFDGFLIRFDSDGARQWGTYFGGSGTDQIQSVACDQLGNVYIAGNTMSSTGIATPGAFRTAYSGGPEQGDAFIARFSSNGNLIWSTYYGGDEDEVAIGVAADRSGHLYVAGTTRSDTGIATPLSHRSVLTGEISGKPGRISSDGFIVKMDTSGARIWGTYYGDMQNEEMQDITVDPFGNPYITGITSSTAGIATPGSYKTAKTNISDEAFLARFSPDGNLSWGTYYGSGVNEFGQGVKTDLGGNVYLFGLTSHSTGSSALATPDAHQPEHGGIIDLFIAKFDSSGRNRIWGTYYGGSGYESAINGVGAVSEWGHIYLNGNTASMNNIATPGSHKPTGGFSQTASGADAFLAAFYDSCAIPGAPVLLSARDTVCIKGQATLSVADVCGMSSYAWQLPDGWSGGGTSSSIQVNTGEYGGDHLVYVAVVNHCGDTGARQTIHLHIAVPSALAINADVQTLSTTNSSYYTSWQWYKNGSLLEHATDSILIADENATYSVSVRDRTGCTDSASYIVNNVSVTDQDALAESITIYPNPAQSKVFIKAPFALNASVRTPDGKLIRLEEQVSGMDISELPAGIYLLQITSHEGRLIRTDKLIKLAD